jgi:lipopolysaccharide export system permease protein
MRVTDNKRYLEFNLKDGWRYQERGELSENDNTEFIRVRFKEYKKQFDLSSFQFTRTADSLNKNNERVYSMRQLDVVIDSLQKQVNILRKRLTNDMYRSQQFVQYLDSSWDVAGTKNFKPVKNFDEILPDSARQLVKERAVSEINSLRVAMDVTGNDLREKEKILELHEIEWHRKISLSLACLVLFLIGAPLGSIIRKGGLGTPLVFAIIFFMLFYFSSNTGEKFAREGSVSAFTGMWMATFVLVPIGIFLTYKAMQDSQLFNKEFYYRIAKFIASLFRKTDRSSTGL